MRRNQVNIKSDQFQLRLNMFGAVAYVVLFVGFCITCAMVRSQTFKGLASGRQTPILDTKKLKTEGIFHAEGQVPEEILVRDYRNQYEFFREQYYYPYGINQDARHKTQFGFTDRGPAYYNVSDICGMDLSSGSSHCDPTRYRCTKIWDHCRYRRDPNNVTVYDCSCSNFTKIPTDFIPTNTTHLDLSHTCITRLPANSFENFTALVWLDLSANYFLAELDENVFGNLSQLTDLTIACLRNLTAYEPEPLYAPYELPPGIFKPLVNLVSLNISGWTGFRRRHLKNAEEILMGLSMPSLRTLSLQFINGIHPGGLLWTLTKKVTKGLSNTSLEYLNIQNNVIISIRPGFLEHISKTLKVLDMSYNVLRGGEFNLLTLNLDYMSKLVFLNFSYQNYIFFYKSSLRSYQSRPNLHGVLLQEPQTVESGCMTINLPPRLETLDLSHRNMIILPYIYQRLCLNTTHSLKYLDMSCSWQDINPFGDNWNMPNLRHLDLSGSKSLLTGKMQFSKLSRLKTLRLAYCYLDEILRNNRTIWEMVLTNIHMPDLEILDLSQNYLEYINPDLINKFRLLKEVYLYHNELSSISLKIAKAKNLRYLDLSRNHIQMLSTAVMDDWEGKKDLTVDLSNNNFECSCQMTDFYFWKKRQNITFKNMYCLDMFNQRKNVSINKITETDFSQCCCVGLVVSIVLYGSFLLLTMIICALCRYRWNLVYLWYSWKTFVSRNKRDKHDKDFIFDAFVCYNPLDVDWIVGELCPHLEDSHHYRLCIHERDFHIGVPILDNITEAFKASKNIILLVSSNYLLGEYIDFELYLACGQYLHKVTCIMLVDPKSFSKKRQQESLEFLLTTKSYLLWPKGDERRRSFWARLRYALGNPLTKNAGNPSSEGYSGLWSELESEGGGNIPD